jgi:hypothetical protein
VYVNGKMMSIETILGLGDGVIKESGGGGELKCDMFDIL